MEWIAVGVIITMFGFAVTVLSLGSKITKPIERLNCSIVELSTKFDGLTDRIDRDGNCNEREHLAIWNEVEEQGKIISKHETEIAVIKDKVG